MKTFKQFLEGQDPLLFVHVEMFFRKELDLPKDEAHHAADWMLGGPDPFDRNGDTWDHIIDYVIAHFMGGKFEPKPDLGKFCHEKLAKVMYDKYGIEL